MCSRRASRHRRRQGAEGERCTGKKSVEVRGVPNLKVLLYKTGDSRVEAETQPLNYGQISEMTQ